MNLPQVLRRRHHIYEAIDNTNIQLHSIKDDKEAISRMERHLQLCEHRGFHYVKPEGFWERLMIFFERRNK